MVTSNPTPIPPTPPAPPYSLKNLPIDILGNTIHIGDIVLFPGSQYVSLNKAIVEKINPKTVSIRHINVDGTPKTGGHYKSYRYPIEIVVVSSLIDQKMDTIHVNSLTSLGGPPGKISAGNINFVSNTSVKSAPSAPGISPKQSAITSSDIGLIYSNSETDSQLSLFK